MSDTSRGRVTITLGRSGQVVKRDQSTADVSFPSYPTVGSKRSVRDRLGHDTESSLWNGNELSGYKRQRGDTSSQNGFNDGRIGRDDLRLKLMRKSASRLADSNSGRRHMDLREKLSRAAQPATTNINSKQNSSEPRETSMLGRIPSARTSGDLARMELVRSSFSPWTLDHIRRRSPEGFPSTSRGISPQRNMEDPQRRPSNRAYDSIRSAPTITRDVEASRLPSAAPSSFVTAKPVAPHQGQLPPSRTPFVGNEQQTPQTVDALLHALGLGKYALQFKAEEVDMTALKQMGENDLKELGIPMGPRKKILLALLPPRVKRQP
ncbi:hypothetical protein QN277_004281 [Acacia crassicarpa]|uniref:SAM domain-containing protein n=1 Tax=Acacia crassicarpa TaxID=499986 RepID=A0AAE1J2L8_9FABA|nr:hypothetical protein QN277_004281 [Acacia crassicarpa]